MYSNFLFGFIIFLFGVGTQPDAKAQFSYQPHPTRSNVLPLERYFRPSSSKHTWTGLSDKESCPAANQGVPLTQALNRLYLPKWCAADLPFFCKIEHNIGLQLPVMVKFRLGSVEYVDWMEGK